MTFLGKCLAIFVFMILPLGMFLMFGYFILRRIFKKDAYKTPFGKSRAGSHSSVHDDDDWIYEGGLSTDDDDSGGDSGGDD